MTDKLIAAWREMVSIMPNMSIGGEVWTNDGEPIMLHMRDLVPVLDRLEAVTKERDALREALAEIAMSGPVNEKGEEDAYAGWSWCYDRAQRALSAERGKGKETRDFGHINTGDDWWGKP